MPAHTQTRRAEDKHTDRQTSADNIALGFRAPWILLPPGSRFTYRMASTAHQTWGQERNSPSRRAGCLPARPLASALRQLERLIRPPFIESFLLNQIPSCFPAGPRIYTGLSCPAWAPVLLFIFPLCLASILFSQSRDPGRAPKCYARCPNPRAGRENASKTMQLAKRKVYYWLEPGLLPHPTQWCRVREPRAPAVTPIYRVNISSW